MTKYLIRQANEKDMGAIAYVASECFPDDYKTGGAAANDIDIAEEWMRKRFNLYPYALFFVATPADNPQEIVGFAFFMMIGGLSGVVQLEIMGVLEKHRRKGIAGKLISESEPIINIHFKKNFNKSVYKFLLTTSMENPNSHSVYKREGYELTGTLGKLYWGTEEVLYTKENK